MTSVLITGAGGFIGRRVAGSAARAGFDIVTVGRRPSPGVDIVCDLRGSLVSLPRVDCVFHLAGAYAGMSQTELERCDVAVARNLLSWGVSVGVRNWVFASAAEVYGRVDGVATENAPIRPVIPYGRVKFRVEELFAQMAAAMPDCRVAILRMGEVYGADSKLLTELRRRLESGFCPWFGAGDVQVSFVHVDDVAQAFVQAALRADTGVNVFNVADDEPATWRAFVGEIAARLGAPAARSLPLPLAHLYAAMSTFGAWISGRPPVITSHIVRLLSTPKAMSNEGVRRALGFRPRYPDFRSGLEEALSGLPNHGQNG